jgi:hypothetical protein
MHYENPRQWRKALKNSMADYILAYHAKGQTSNPNEGFTKWAEDHKVLLGKFGRYCAEKLARQWWGRWIKKLARKPATDEAQLFLEGMEVFRNVDPRFYFEREGKRLSVNTHESTHMQRQAGIAMLRRGIRYDIERAERMEALDDWSAPLVKRFGDGPLIDQIRQNLEAERDDETGT